jgi:hypothetical protein
MSFLLFIRSSNMAAFDPFLKIYTRLSLSKMDDKYERKITRTIPVRPSPSSSLKVGV